MAKLTDKDVRVFGTTSANVNIPIKVTSDAASPPKGLVNVANSSGANFYVRNTEYGTSGLSNYYWNIAGILEIPTTVIGDPIGGIPAKVVALGDGTGELTSGGGIAHDAVNVGNPLQIGGHAYSGTPTVVSNGDRVRAWFNLNGALGVHDAGGSITVDGSVSVLGTVTVTPSYSDGEDTSGASGFWVGGRLFGSETWSPFETTKMSSDDIDISANYFLTASALLAFDGAALDRMTGDSSNGLDVDVTRLPALVAGTANIGDVDVLTFPPSSETSGSASSATTIISNQNCSQMAHVAVQLTGTWSGTVQVQESLDGGTTWVATVMHNANTASTAGSTSMTANGIYWASIKGSDLLRVQCTAYTSGTIVANMVLSPIPKFPNQVSPSAVGNVAHDAADSGNPVKVGGYANNVVRADVSANADRVDASFDLAGRQRVSSLRKMSIDTANYSADAEIIAAPGASLNLVICHISAYNRSTANSVQIDFKDGSGGSVVHTMVLNALGSNSSSVENFMPGYILLSANTAFYADLTGTTPDVNINVKYLTTAGEI